MEDEAHNLKEFAKERCEDAFAALVQQHAGMVFGTAYRRSGDRELAEEISQKVFTILARKAPRLSGEGSLAGWLHRTTLLQTRNFLRKQQRQREKMDALAEYQNAVADGGPQDHEILQVLDEAIDKLSSGDRRVVLMRFFEGLSVREIALATGKSEAASQKQSHRALQKLSTLLKRSGVIVPATVLVSQIVPTTSKAASVSLATSLSNTALAGAASISVGTLAINSLLTLTYIKSILAATTAVAIGAAVVIPMTLKSNREGTSPTISNASLAPAAGTTEIENTPAQQSNSTLADDPFRAEDAESEGTQPESEFEFRLVEMNPNAADVLHAALTNNTESALKAMTELDENIKQGSVKSLGELKIQTTAGKRAKASEGGETDEATIRNDEAWELPKKEGLNIELDYQPQSDQVAMAIFYYAKGKGADTGKLAELKLQLGRVFVPGVPSLVYRSDRDGKARILLATMMKGAQPKGTALRELTAQLYEFETGQARDAFFAKSKNAADVVGKLQEAARLTYQAVCASSPDTLWKLGDLADLQKKADDTWTKDGTSLYVEAGAEIKGSFSDQETASVIAECKFANLKWERVELIKCEGSKPCLLVIQTKLSGKAAPKADLPEDPFDDPF